ncbi:phosphomevalonate kinase [Jeotgalibaca ciconiae]|uniref:phosphomevalonate kinase n=1 Tax=Jeotgalibaca ciconiae TaxID=2496265 RepID=A0A3Q9BIV4_9LACT|nr:phosphomevalonate kinase [Jeotgalibaca ciconiae]AZP03389.1 phosphomevalonate kinase [Jeotgalibaca ciconiae]HJB22535.1 phosphomevalonate kinase [Candidatus Jeotgalibaca pullicola]
MVQASAPGKLFIAGEYAVVTHAHPAILVAVNQFITVTVEKAEEEGSIHSSLNGGLPIPWTRQNGKLYIDERENPFFYITQAVKYTEQYIQEKNKELEFFHLSVESELDNAKGKKYGLGSSGAVTVATIKALLKFYDLEMTSELVYKLAALAHLSVNSNGSFGDIAASSYTGWIAYACFNRQWVLEQEENMSITELVALPWPDLMIKQLQVPQKLKLLIGWTGSPASTTHLVDKVNHKRGTLEGFFPIFLRKSKTCVNALIDAFETGDVEAIKIGINRNRQLLQRLAQQTGVKIETELLSKLVRIAEKFGGSGKSSGAGGGDCGIVLIEEDKDLTSLLADWRKAGIQPLPLEVFYEKK